MIIKQTLCWYNLTETVHSTCQTKQCSNYEKIWRQNVLLKQKVMPISQTSLKITHASPDVPKRYFRLRARDHIVGTSKLFWYIYRLDIYIVSIYVHTHVTWMLACASCTSCSSAGALANMTLAWPESERSFGWFHFYFTSDQNSLFIYEYSIIWCWHGQEASAKLRMIFFWP